MLHMSKSSNISQQASSAEEKEGEGVERVKTKPLRRKKTSVSHRESEDRTDIAAVCVESFKFLKALAKDYTDVQER